MKKIAALLLAMVMVLGMSMTVFADENETPGTSNNNGAIQISQAVNGATYNVYKLFDLESFTNDNYSYKVVDAWKDFFTGEAYSGFVTLDSNGYVTGYDSDKYSANSATMEQLAQAALAYAKDKEIQPSASISNTENNATIKFENLPLGYYLVDSTVGSFCNLTTTALTATIIDKNTPTTVDKEVKEDSSSSTQWGGENTAEVGDTVPFKATITIGAGATDLVMHDRMDEGLTFKQVTKVTYRKYNETEGKELTKDTDYYVTLHENYENDDCVWTDGNGCTFVVTFSDEIKENLEKDDQVVVEYEAVVDEDALAVVNVRANINYVTVKYSEGHFSNQDYTKTWLFDLKIFKYYGENTPLAGAGFTLYYDEACQQPVRFKNVTGVTGTYTSCTAEECSHEHQEEVITGATGILVMTGLDEGVYYLKETTTPAGFAPLTNEIKVEIQKDGYGIGKVFVDNDTSSVERVDIKNETTSALPETGGMGTTVIYIVGAILVVVAGVILISRKRINHEE